MTMPSRLLRARAIAPAAFSLLLLLALWQGAAFTGCAYLQIGYVRLICPVGFLELGLSAKSIPLDLLPGFALMVGLITLVGRAYCAWMCPASFLAQKAAAAGGKLLPSPVRAGGGKKLRALRERLHGLWRPGRGDAVAICAGLALGIVLAGFPAWSVICPVGTLSRTLVDAVIHHSPRLDALFLLLPVLAALFHRQGWKCLCPLGTVHGLLSSGNRTLRVKVDASRCNQCGLCTRRCPMGLSPDPVSGIFNQRDCIKCLNCHDRAGAPCVRPGFAGRSKQLERAEQTMKDGS